MVTSEDPIRCMQVPKGVRACVRACVCVCECDRVGAYNFPTVSGWV